MKTNYHAHTPRCQHAVGAEEEYVQAAIKAGFDVLGFSDHTPWPYATGYRSRIRMDAAELEDYISAVRRVQSDYQNDIRIHLGMEVEYIPRYMDYMRHMRDAGISYFLLGQHSIDSEEDDPALWTAKACEQDDMVQRFADVLTEGMRTGLFAYVAHPDIYLRHRLPGQFSKACEKAADAICQCAMEEHIPLEYNLLGLKYQHEGEEGGYPNPEFWQYISRYPVKTILGVDAHDPRHLLNRALWDEGMGHLKAWGFEVLDHLPMDDEL